MSACCGFREGVKDTAKNEDIVRCAWHEAWRTAREEAAKVLGCPVPTALTGGAQVHTGARWVRLWTMRHRDGESRLYVIPA